MQAFPQVTAMFANRHTNQNEIKHKYSVELNTSGPASQDAEGSRWVAVVLPAGIAAHRCCPRVSSECGSLTKRLIC